jgi:hypothetical protein
MFRYWLAVQTKVSLDLKGAWIRTAALLLDGREQAVNALL